MVDIMARELTGYFNSRAGDRKPWTQPMAGLWGPKVMVMNERAGSGGDLLPYLFRFKGVGPLVGTTTWGGLVGTWDTPPLIERAVEEALRLLETEGVELLPEPAPPVRYRRPGGR